MNYEDYGWTPLDFLTDWFVDETQAALAQVGIAVGKDVYDTIPSSMKEAPSNTAEAYEQAVYWLALARRRADYEDEATAASMMSRALTTLQAEQAQANFSNPVCMTTGWFCSSKGMSAVLQYAIDTIGTSGLNQEDQTRILAYLQTNQRGAFLRQLVPYLVLGSVAVGAWWYYQKPSATSG